MMRNFPVLSRYIKLESWLEWVGLVTLFVITFFAFNLYPSGDQRRWAVLLLFGLIILLELCSAEPAVHLLGRSLGERQVENIRLALMTVVTLALIALDVNFTALIILYFIFSARALFIFPDWVGYLWILLFGAITTITITAITWPTWQYGLLNGLGSTCGYFFMGSAANAQRRAELANTESRRLLGELQTAHHQLQKYADRIEQLAVAEERNRLAREMHDTLGHRLTVAAVQLEGAQKLVSRDPAKAETMIGTVHGQVIEGLSELRKTVAALRSPLADDLPLLPALRQLVANFVEATHMIVVLRLLEVLPDLSPAQQQAIYRAAQESLTNIQRHAQADQVKMTLAWADAPPETVTGTALLCLSVEDNGIGPAAITPGYGLQGLTERATALGGHFTVEAGATLGGTRLTFMVPVRRNNESPLYVTTGTDLANAH